MNNPELCFKIFTYFIETQALKTLFKIEFFLPVIRLQDVLAPRQMFN